MNLRNFPSGMPRRIPQLYFGRDAQPVALTGREKLADGLFTVLWVLSWALPAIGGVGGYFLYQYFGILLFAILGYGLGAWMRRSLGVRGRRATTGFFMRMRERAQGMRPGVLETMLERLSRHELTAEKCRSIVLAYDRAIKQLRRNPGVEERNKILAGLDRRVKEIVYE